MACVPTETLERFLDGAAADRAAVAAHLADCAQCRGVLDHLSDKPDLRRWLPRALALPTVLAEDPVLMQVLTNVESASGVLPQIESSTQRASHWPSGHVLDQYRIEGEIGRGGMGVVLRAYDEALGRVVALKILRSQETDAKARARLVREAQAVAKLRHDNVVTVHAVVNPPDDPPYLVMEYLEGETVAVLIRSQGRLRPEEAVAILVQVAAGLETTHAAGLIHRDIKPSNILVDPRTGRAKITDFGLARSAESSGPTLDGTLAGTPTYMSPEQVRGHSDLDCRSDIYSLGVTLYEALTGEVPFRGVPHMVFQQVLGEEPRSPRLLNDTVPRDLETICLKAMAKELGRRYQTAREIADDLRRWQRGEPIQARPVGRLERGWRWCRRKPSVAGLALALVLVMSGGVAGISWKWAEAVQERRRTERERDRAVRNFRQAREAVDTYLTQVSDNPVLKAENLEPLRRELLRTARDFYERFVQQEPDDPDLQVELGRAYERLGLITTVLESSPRALEHYQKMQAIFARLYRADPNNPAFRKELAQSYLRQAESYRAGVSGAIAEISFHRARELQEALVRDHPGEPAYQHDLARSLRKLGNLYLFLTNDHRKAEDVLLAAREIYGHLPALYLQQPDVRYEHALVLLNLAKLYAHTDRPEQDRAAAEAAIALFEPLVRNHAGNPDHVMCLTDSLSELGESYRKLAQPELAQATLEKALSSSQELARSHPTNGYYRHAVADIDYSLASLNYHERHRPAEAHRLLQEALDIEQELTISFPRVSEYLFYMNNLLRDLRDWFGDTARLDAVLDRMAGAIREHQARFPPEKRDSGRLGLYYHYCSLIHALLGQYGKALSDCKHSGGTDLMIVSWLQAQRGEYDQAESGAMTITKSDLGNGSELYRAAQLSAYMAGVARNDRTLPAVRRQELGEKYGRQAVQWLAEARSLKYLSAPSTRFLLADDRDLDPLRSRDDFKALLARSIGAPTERK